jgi:hypothetical protein
LWHAYIPYLALYDVANKNISFINFTALCSPYCVSILHSTLITFSAKNYELGKTLSRVIFISTFIKEQHSGVHRYEYPYHAVTSKQVLIIFSVKIATNVGSHFIRGHSCLSGGVHQKL